MLAPGRGIDYMANMRSRLARFQPVAAAFAVCLQMAAAIPARADDRPELDALFAELAQTDGDGWMQAENEIARLWSQSGSAAADYLLMRGEAALDAGDVNGAIGHLTALVETAPDFAPGLAARAAAFAAAGQTGPAVADIAATLRIEPRHWLALTLLGSLLEDSGSGARALAAYRASLAINPHQDDANDAVARLTAAHQGQGV